jgi:hypothetical protein
MTKKLPKLGQGPTGPQHSPVTHLKSLWYDQFGFECLELGPSCFDLLLFCGLLFGELLDYCVTPCFIVTVLFLHPIVLAKKYFPVLQQCIAPIGLSELALNLGWIVLSLLELVEGELLLYQQCS